MNSLIRRRFLGRLASSAATGLALQVTRLAKARQPVNIEASKLGFALVRPALRRASETRTDPLLPAALRWIGRQRSQGVTILVHPVSRLQCEFGLGYASACALAASLAQHGEWTVGHDDDGIRRARVHGTAGDPQDG